MMRFIFMAGPTWRTVVGVYSRSTMYADCSERALNKQPADRGACDLRFGMDICDYTV